MADFISVSYRSLYQIIALKYRQIPSSYATIVAQSGKYFLVIGWWYGSFQFGLQSELQPKISPDVRRRPTLPGRTDSASPLCGLHGDAVLGRAQRADHFTPKTLCLHPKDPMSLTQRPYLFKQDRRASVETRQRILLFLGIHAGDFITRRGAIASVALCVWQCHLRNVSTLYNRTPVKEG